MKTSEKASKNKTDRQRYERLKRNARCEKYKKLLNEVEMKYRKNAMKSMQDENTCRFLDKKINRLLTQL